MKLDLTFYHLLCSTVQSALQRCVFTLSFLKSSFYSRDYSLKIPDIPRQNNYRYLANQYISIISRIINI